MNNDDIEWSYRLPQLACRARRHGAGICIRDHFSQMLLTACSFGFSSENKSKSQTVSLAPANLAPAIAHYSRLDTIAARQINLDAGDLLGSRVLLLKRRYGGQRI